MPLYCRLVDAFFGMASRAFAAAVPQGCTQGTRPASSSAMILSVISSSRLARSWPARALTGCLDIADLRDGRREPLSQPSTRHGKPGRHSYSQPLARGISAEHETSVAVSRTDTPAQA